MSGCEGDFKCTWCRVGDTRNFSEPDDKFGACKIADLESELQRYKSAYEIAIRGIERLGRHLPMNHDGWKEGNHKSISVWCIKEASLRTEYATKIKSEADAVMGEKDG